MIIMKDNLLSKRRIVFKDSFYVSVGQGKSILFIFNLLIKHFFKGHSFES